MATLRPRPRSNPSNPCAVRAYVSLATQEIALARRARIGLSVLKNPFLEVTRIKVNSPWTTRSAAACIAGGSSIVAPARQCRQDKGGAAAAGGECGVLPRGAG